MWLALVATLALIVVGGWKTLTYARDSLNAPPIASVGAPAATPTARVAVSGSGAVVASSSRPLPTSTPGAETLAQAPSASPTPSGDWFAQLVQVSGQAARSLAGAPSPATPRAAAPTRSADGRATPPPPVNVDAAAAAATARALVPTPEAGPDILPPAPRPSGSHVTTPTPVRRAVPASTPAGRSTPSDEAPDGSADAELASAPSSASAVGTPRPGATPRPGDGAQTTLRRSEDSLGADATPSTTRAPRPTRTPHDPWARRPNGFATPPAIPSTTAHPTPGAPTYTPPAIKNGDDKWGVGVYKDSNRVLDGMKETQPGVILLMDPSEGWARKVRETFPNAFIVGRRYKPETQQPLDNPDKRGADFADYVAELAVPLRGVVDAWESYNEVLGSEPSNDYANYDKFQVAFAKRLQNGYGVAAVAANDGSGALDPEDYPTYFADAIRASQFFGVHAYSAPGTNSIKVDAESNVLRYRKIHDALERAGIKNVKMVLTESGLGDGFRQGVASDESMANDFAWLTSELRKDPYVIGQAAFGYFDDTGAWPKFDLTASSVGRLLPGLIRR